MSRVLITWELGGNYGHLTRTLPVAEKLRQLGHNVLFATRDVGVANELLTKRSFPFVSVPLPARAVRLQYPPGNYAELLLMEGFGEIATLAGTVRAWLHLINLFTPDAIVVDHSPTAIIAAHIARLPVVAIDGSFALPPYPFPSIRTLDDRRSAEVRNSEIVVTATINQLLKEHRSKPFESLAEMFVGHDLLITNFPELDHFGPRDDVTYVGPIGADVSQDEVCWHSSQALKIFAYLRSQANNAVTLLRVLHDLDAAVIAVVSGLDSAQVGQVQRPGMRVMSRPVAIRPMLQQASIIISHGGSLTTQAVANGIPTLVLPHTPEQQLRGLRVEALGVGINVGTDRSQNALRAAIHALAEDRCYKSAAKRFAQKHADFDQDTAVQLVASRIERAIASG